MKRMYHKFELEFYADRVYSSSEIEEMLSVLHDEDSVHEDTIDVSEIESGPEDSTWFD